jgi:hypothetical protein
LEPENKSGGDLHQLIDSTAMKANKNWSRSFTSLKRFALLSVLVLLALQNTAAPSDKVERISRKDLKPAKDGMPEEKELTREVIIAPNIKLVARIEVSAKGNGSLRIANLDLKVFDGHEDGAYYEHEMLNIDFSDIDDDGERELVISGIVCFTDEKGDKVLRREAVVFIYALQFNRTFKQVYRNTDYQLD